MEQVIIATVVAAVAGVGAGFYLGLKKGGVFASDAYAIKAHVTEEVSALRSEVAAALQSAAKKL